MEILKIKSEFATVFLFKPKPSEPNNKTLLPLQLISAKSSFDLLSKAYTQNFFSLKNFFLYTKHSELAHKPALIVSISAGRGGSYPVHELRTSSYKNNRLCYIPEHLIIRNVESFLKQDSSNIKENQFIAQRIEQTLSLLYDLSLIHI